MRNLSRRDFLLAGAAGTGLVTSPLLRAGEVQRQNSGASRRSTGQSSAADRVELGTTGIRVSRIAMGTGFRGWQRASNQTRLGQDGFTRLMRHGFDEGINFYDLADLYGSHLHMRNTLKEIPRDEIVLLSKIWLVSGEGMEVEDSARLSVERFRQELGVDMIDIVLLHCVTNSRWTQHRARLMEEIDELKEREMIRATGVSCHDKGALEIAADSPWVDVIFARINNRQKAMDGTPEEISAILKRARANGKAIVGMKIYGAGTLTAREDRDASLRYVWGEQLIDAMTIGFEKTEQVTDTVEHLRRVFHS